jgi:hypothetical protein
VIRPGVLIQGFQLPGVRPGGQSWGSTRGFSSTCHCSQRVGSELRELRDTTHQGRWRTKETSSVLDMLRPKAKLVEDACQCKRAALSFSLTFSLQRKHIF